MEPHIIEMTKAEKKEAKASALTQILPIARACLISVPFVFITNELILHWGGVMPSIIWGTPLIMLFCYYLLLFSVALTPTKIIFTEKSLKIRGFHADSIKWESVQSWDIKDSDSSILAIFNLTWGRSKKVVFHHSVGLDNIRSLIKKYGNI